MARQSGIYKIVNQVNGRFYIGSAIDLEKRWRNHQSDFNKGKHGNGYLQRAWNKYGSDKFTFEVLEHCEPSELIRMEQDYIDSACACDNGYNICPVAGNRLGTKMPPDAVRRTAEANRGRKMSDEVRRKMSLARKGTKRSEEIKRKLSEAKMGEKNPMYGQHRTGKDAPRYGHRATEETRRKMSATRMGKKMPPFTEEHRKNMSIAAKKRKYTKKRRMPPLTEEHKKKLSLATAAYWKRIKQCH